METPQPELHRIRWESPRGAVLECAPLTNRLYRAAQAAIHFAESAATRDPVGGALRFEDTIAGVCLQIAPNCAEQLDGLDMFERDQFLAYCLRSSELCESESLDEGLGGDAAASGKS